MNKSKVNSPESGRRCAVCGHYEFEHGTTGTHPCLVSVGNPYDPDFCPCDAFHPELVKAA